MVLTNFCTRVGRVLKTCAREGRVFGEKCILERVGFLKEFVSKGYIFYKFSALCANFLFKSIIVNFRNHGNCVNLHKRLQWIMFSSSCTNKGILF